jgi:hypothetical protein
MIRSSAFAEAGMRRIDRPGSERSDIISASYKRSVTHRLKTSYDGMTVSLRFRSSGRIAPAVGAVAIICISSIHLLRAFIEASDIGVEGSQVLRGNLCEIQRLHGRYT